MLHTCRPGVHDAHVPVFGKGPVDGGTVVGGHRELALWVPVLLERTQDSSVCGWAMNPWTLRA